MQWEQSIHLNRDKLFGPSSSLSLENFVTPTHIDPVDFRHLAAPTHRAGHTTYHAFTRVSIYSELVYHNPCSFRKCIKCVLIQGDATTGWNFGTVADQQLAQQQLASTLAKSKHNSRSKAAILKTYKTPMDNSAAVAQKVKETKQAAAMQLLQLEQKYGKEGAAAMQQILQMTPLKYKWQHKVQASHILNRLGFGC